MFKWREGQQEVIHHTNIRRGITSSFARALKVLQQKHLQFNEEEFIYSNDASNNLCNSLEAAFLHGLKDSVAHKLTAYVGLTAAPDSSTVMNFWSVVAKFTHSDVVTQLQNLTQINTEIGLCRAWVRIALNDGLMESYLHSMIVDTKTLKYFYHSYAYLRDHEQPGILKNYLTGLMSLEFKLSFNSSVLNHWNNSTLQLLGALETQPAPSPTVRHAQMGHTGVVSVRQADTSDNKTAVSTVDSVHSHTSKSEATLDFAGCQDVTDLETAAAAAKSDTASYLSLTASEGSSSSHVSCPDPPGGPVSEPLAGLSGRESRDSSVASPSLQYTADDDDSSGKFNVSEFPQLEDNGRQGTWDVSEEQGLSAAEPSVGRVVRTQTSNIVVEKAVLLDNATPPRPRSRRVGEEDVQFISSSVSPLTSRNVTPAHSVYDHSDEGQSMGQKAALSSTRHFNQNSHVDQKFATFSKESGETHMQDQNEILASHQDTQHTLTSQNDHKAATSADIFARLEQLDQEIVLRKPKDKKSQVFSDTKESNEASFAVGVTLNDATSSLANGTGSLAVSDKAVEKHLENQQRQSVVGESNLIKFQNTANRSRQSSSVPTDSENRLSAHSRSEENDEHGHVSRTVAQGFKHSHGSSVYQSAVQQEPVATGHPGERSSSMAINYSESSQHNRDIEEAETAIEISVSPSRFGNSLGSLSGWSSELESKAEKRKRSAADRNKAESFATMLRAYAPASTEGSYTPTLNEVIEALPCETDGDNSNRDRKSEEESPTRNSDNSQSSRMYFLFHVPRELGLSHQNFACKGCFSPIGIIYGQPRICEFDGGLYCQRCHENKETYIPSSILYDWDFRKKKVCQDNFRFLQELEDQALYDVEELNPNLYTHVPELQELKLLRQQLCYLKSYLFTCSQKVAESLRQKVWPREHLYDRRDLYSVTDFLQVQSGALQKLVKDLVKFSSQHVYDCVLCSQKGFVCEICRNPQVIYPFEVNTTVRCQTCKQVYHQSCKTESQPCPKCERWGRHISNTSISEDHPEDYGMSPR
ncbi:hypothetical protein BsWGS_26830 [Bradybaena similaris]